MSVCFWAGWAAAALAARPELHCKAHRQGRGVCPPVPLFLTASPGYTRQDKKDWASIPWFTGLVQVSAPSLSLPPTFWPHNLISLHSALIQAPAPLCSLRALSPAPSQLCLQLCLHLCLPQQWASCGFSGKDLLLDWPQPALPKAKATSAVLKCWF
jgi:hypothetical protein